MMVGENELGPPPTDFSVGETSGALEADDDNGVEVVFGSSLVLVELHPASAPITTIAEPPSMSVT